MKLIMVRHGETEENITGIIQGHSPGKLTRKGIEQAKKAGLRLKNENIDVIFCSDLGRAKDTAKEIIKYHKVPVHYSSQLREIGRGIFDGRPREEYYNAHAKSGLPLIEFRPKNGETSIDVRERAGKFLERILEEYKNNTVLVVSHGGFMRYTLGIIMKKPIEESLAIPQYNCCINVIEFYKDKKHEIKKLNCTMHLDSKTSS